MTARRLRHLVIFARRPAYGVGKRRLAAGVGELEALRFQRASLDIIVRRLTGDGRWRAWVAITPDRGRLQLRSTTLVPQGEGDLGRRLSHVVRRLPPGQVVIVGTDAPQVRRGDIADAFAALDRADAVFGPAEDGGYWLVGLSPAVRRVAVFDNVRWSSPAALSDTLRNLGDRPAAFLRVIEDIDDAESLQRLRACETRPLSLIPPPGQRTGFCRVSRSAGQGVRSS